MEEGGGGRLSRFCSYGRDMWLPGTQVLEGIDGGKGNTKAVKASVSLKGLLSLDKPVTRRKERRFAAHSLAAIALAAIIANTQKRQEP